MGSVLGEQLHCCCLGKTLFPGIGIAPGEDEEGVLRSLCSPFLPAERPGSRRDEPAPPQGPGGCVGLVLKGLMQLLPVLGHLLIQQENWGQLGRSFLCPNSPVGLLGREAGSGL